MAPTEELQIDESTRTGWINYSAFDAKSTHQLHSALEASLARTACNMDPAIEAALGISSEEGRSFSMLDLYKNFWQPFGELLTDMEKEGMLVNR